MNGNPEKAVYFGRSPSACGRHAAGDNAEGSARHGYYPSQPMLSAASRWHTWTLPAGNPADRSSTCW
jgi:hypothetical protein